MRLAIAVLLSLVATLHAPWLPARETKPPGVAIDAAATPDVVDLEAVLVSGRHAGPPLWKVVHGGHTLWILGTVDPVPRRMEWYSPQAEAVLAQAQELIRPPAFVGDMGPAGMFRAALAMPTLLRARNNPDGRSLREVLPPDLYARWAALKPLYLGNDAGVERRRPVFAAAGLYQAALKRAGLVRGSGVGERIGELVKRHGIATTSTQVRVRISDPKGLARSFSRARLDDTQCFRTVLDRLEADVSGAAERANAWARGDLSEIRRLHGASLAPCYQALAETEAARAMGMGEGMARSERQWLDAAERALAAHTTSFATLPMGQLLEQEGLLARLQRRGYEVVAPD